MPLTLWSGDGDSSGTTTLIVETSCARPTRVPVRLRHFPEYDSKVYPSYNFFKEILETDDDGRLHIPISLAKLEQRPFYWVTLRIEATPAGVAFSVRRMTTKRSNDGPVVDSGFAHIG